MARLYKDALVDEMVVPQASPYRPTLGTDGRVNQPGTASPGMPGAGTYLPQGITPYRPDAPGGTPSPTAPPAAAPSAPVADRQLFGLEGFDADKLRSGHDSPKYQIGRTLQQFDPSKGLTPEAIAALNQLGLGTFEAIDGDKLRVSGNVDPRFNGLTEFDVVRDFTGGNPTAWHFESMQDAGGGGGAAAPALSAMPGIGGLPMTTPGINPLLSGDPLARIQDAIGQINNQGQVNLDALLRNLQGV